MDEPAARKQVEKVVSGLIPNAFDEATGHVPMNLINSWADQWIDQVDGEFDTYRHEVRREIGLTKAALAELDRLGEADDRRLAELDAARRAAFADLGARAETPQPAAADVPYDGEDPPTGPIKLEPAEPPAPTGPDPGYRAPSLAAGRPVGVFVHVVALVLAALADFGAFGQVVQLVMADQSALVSYAVVLGLTATVLYLAHAVGVMVRDRVARTGAARWSWIVLATLGWALIGAIAYWVRLEITLDETRSPSISLSSAPSAPASEADSTTLPAAILFLALFVGSGLVAAIGAYVTHNPLAGAYRSTCQKYRTAATVAGETAGVRTAVERRLRHLRRALRKARQLRDREHRRRRHFAEELKQFARTQMASHVQDPAFSDALFTSDRLPYPDFPADNGTSSRTNGNPSPGAR